MALQDIENGHGLLFIDPHYDAINDLLARIPQERAKDVIFLDPTDEKRSFGLNVLHCDEPENEIELDKAVGRVRDIFTKAWGGETGYLGLWLDKIISNSAYLLLENPDPGYTLVDVPLVVDEDTTFRNELLKNVKVTMALWDFWHREFDRLTRRDKTEQVGPALTRVNALRTNHTLRGIVGQKESTIDFGNILKIGKIVLLRLPSNMDRAVKGLIGTIVLSEFLYAVHERGKLGKDDRPYFGVYCDEFQQFATPDFADLFTQTGKFGVMPVVAHQTREQFKARDDPNRGATAASPNKALFTLSTADARELGLEFARDPQAGQDIISQEPVRDLLKGHKNPQIRKLVDLHLRPLKEKLEDTRDLMEGERLIRTDLLDEAALARLDERIDWIEDRGRSSSDILGRAQEALGAARLQTGRMQGILDLSMDVKKLLRNIDRFFIALMEGMVTKGTEAYSNVLIRLMRDCSYVPQRDATILALYISLLFGECDKPCVLPVAFVRKYAIWTKEETGRRLEDRYRSERLLSFEEGEARKRLRENTLINTVQDDIYVSMKNFRTWNGGKKNVSEDSLRTYILLQNYPRLADVLAPYLTARFRRPWDRVFENESADFVIDQMTEQSDQFERVKGPVLKEVASFLRETGEGAMIVTALLNVGLGLWTKDLYTPHNPVPSESKLYRSMHMLEVPAIAGKELLDTLLFIKRLNNLLGTIIPGAGSHFARVYEYRLNTYGEEYIRQAIANNFYLRCIKITPRDLFKAHDSGPTWSDVRYMSNRLAEEKEEVAETLLSEVSRQPEMCFDQDSARLWTGLDEFTQAYLIARACDTVWFGERVAKYTYPEPAIPGVRGEHVARLISILITMAEQDRKARKRETEEGESRFLSVVHKTVAEADLDLEETVKDLLPQVLTPHELEKVKEACRKEINSAPQAAKMMETIHSFVELCELLARAENHIKVQAAGTAGVRTEADMVNEMARVLTGMPRYTAFAKIVDEEAGEAVVWKGKIRTAKLPDIVENMANEVRDCIEKNVSRYTRTREEIREEIRKRQEPWRQRLRVEAPPTRIEEGKEAMSSKKQDSEPEEESAMPPTSVTQDLKEGGKERRGEDNEGKGEEEPREREDGLPPEVRVKALQRREKASETLMRLEERIGKELREAGGDGHMVDQVQKAETEREDKTATIYKGEACTIKWLFETPVSSGTVTVDFGDGGEETFTFSGAEFLMRHVYTTAGRFTVNFSITDNKGWTITETNTVIVLVPTQNDDQDVLETGLEDLEKRIAVVLGVEGSTEEEHLEVIDQATDAILKQIFLDTVQKLSHQDAEEYAKLIEAEASPEYINKFLNRKIPGYGEFTRKIVDKFLNELKEA